MEIPKIYSFHMAKALNMSNPKNEGEITDQSYCYIYTSEFNLDPHLTPNTLIRFRQIQGITF